MTWQEAARGIPVWQGCIFITEDGSHHRCTDFTEASTYRDESVVWSGSYEFPPAECAPDLSDPDTRAAYDRRLALALGAPQEQADNGATMYYSSVSDSWWVSAGDGSWCKRLIIDTQESLLARALAWPAEKRVRA